MIMAARLQNVLILQKSKSLPAKLRETLRLQGYHTQTVFDVESALITLKELKSVLLLVDCGDNRLAASQTVQQLVDTPDICDYPALLLVPNPQDFKEALDRYFILAKSLEAPCGLPQVMDGIGEMSTAYPSYLKYIATLAPDKLPPSPEQQALAAVAQEPAPPPPAYPEKGGVPELFFDQLTSIPPAERSLNGECYTSRIEEALLIQKGCYPADKQVQAIVRVLCQEFEPRDEQHLHRTAFINGQSCKAMNIEAELREHALAASYLYAYAFSQTNPHLLRGNYLAAKNDDLRRSIGSVIRESAAQVRGSGMEQIASVIDKMGCLLERSDQPEEDEHTLVASALLAADLMDRICFREGYWDPQAVHGFLSKIRSGALGDIHPRVLPCIVRITVESIAAKRPAYLVPKALRTSPGFLEGVRKYRDLKVTKQETKVQISDLTPGMILSRPVTTMDGAVVLSSDLVLDSDLIFRVWQLATVRIINTPLIVAIPAQAGVEKKQAPSPKKPKATTRR
jgi:hypothetical protein